ARLAVGRPERARGGECRVRATGRAPGSAARVDRGQPAARRRHRRRGARRGGGLAMNTPVCELLGIEFPLLAFSHCRDVVASVTNAGAFGVLGAMRYDADELEIVLRWIDERVGGKPYGVDIIVPQRFEGKGEGLDS